MLKQYINNLIRDKKSGVPAGIAKLFLLTASYVYGATIFWHDRFYKTGILKTHKVCAKIISVGNITLGGTGKTPFTIMLAELLANEGKKVGVLIRGYGEDEYRLLEDKLSQRGVKVFVGRDRVKTASEAAREGYDTIILDDGFQHRRLGRDMDITLIDSGNPFGNQRLFPRGILREKVEGLKRTDIIVLTKIKDKNGTSGELLRKIDKIAPGKIVLEAAHRPAGLTAIINRETKRPDYLRGRKILLLSAICDPDYFRTTALKTGARVESEIIFPDHYQYKKQDMARISSECKKKKIDAVVTTEKDAVKLKELMAGYSGPEILALQIEMEITKGKDRLDARLRMLYSGQGS